MSALSCLLHSAAGTLLNTQETLQDMAPALSALKDDTETVKLGLAKIQTTVEAELLECEQLAIA